MTIKNSEYTIASFVNVQDVPKILDELTQAGFSEAKISVIAQDPKGQLSTFSPNFKKKYGNYAVAGTRSGAVTGGCN